VSMFWKEKNHIFQVTECQEIQGNWGREAQITYVCKGREFKNTVPCYELMNLDAETSRDLIENFIPNQEANSDLLAFADEECPTCEGIGTVETRPMFWGATAEDASPAEFETCPDCKGTKTVVSEVRDTTKTIVADIEEYNPWENAS